jgi:hypothetical protein
LQRAFTARSLKPKNLSANAFLARIEPTLKKSVTRQTGAGSYLFGHAAWTLRRRASALDLVLRGNQREAKKTALRLYLKVIQDLLRRNRERYVI